MKKFIDTVSDATTGLPLRAATVTVYRAGTQTLALLYSDNLSPPTPTGNPVLTNDAGEYAFYAANGRYDLVIAQNGFTSSTLYDVEIFDFVSIEDFGGMPDGTTDNSPIVQAAINILGLRGGGSLYFPPGIYRFNSPITIQYSGITLCGANSLATRFVFFNPAGNSIELLGATSPGIYNCCIRDIYIEHTTKTSGSAIKLHRVNQTQLERVMVGNGWNGLDAETINNCNVSYCVFANLVGDYGGKYHSSLDGTERSDVLSFFSTVFQMGVGGKDGVIWDGFAHTLRSSGLSILNARYGLWVRNTGGSSQYYPAFGEFYGLEIDGTTGTSVKIDAGSDMSFSAADIFCLASSTGPVLEVTADTGASETNQIRFVGGRILGGAKEAVSFAGKNLILTGSHIGGGSQVGFSAVKVSNGSSDFIITDNQIGSVWGSPLNKYDYGVDLGATASRGLVENNNFYGCNGEVNNPGNSATVWVGQNLNRTGLASMPNSFIRTSYNNTGQFEDKLYNASSGAGVSTRRSLATATANSFVIEALHDNAGVPFLQKVGGSAVLQQYQDFNQHFFRTLAGVQQFVVGASLGNYANDAAAAAGGVPLYGYYRNGTAVQQRQV